MKTNDLILNVHHSGKDDCNIDVRRNGRKIGTMSLEFNERLGHFWLYKRRQCDRIYHLSRYMEEAYEQLAEIYHADVYEQSSRGLIRVIHVA